MSPPDQQLVSLFERLGEQIGRRFAPNFARAQPAPAPAPAPVPAPKAKPRRPAAPKPGRKAKVKAPVKAKAKEPIPALRPAERIAPGRTVWYRQGRGAFEAEVIRINAENGTVVLQRISDLQRVVRPRAKVLRAR